MQDFGGQESRSYSADVRSLGGDAREEEAEGAGDEEQERGEFGFHRSKRLENGIFLTADCTDGHG